MVNLNLFLCISIVMLSLLLTIFSQKIYDNTILQEVHINKSESINETHYDILLNENYIEKWDGNIWNCGNKEDLTKSIKFEKIYFILDNDIKNGICLDKVYGKMCLNVGDKTCGYQNCINNLYISKVGNNNFNNLIQTAEKYLNYEQKCYVKRLLLDMSKERPLKLKRIFDIYTVLYNNDVNILYEHSIRTNNREYADKVEKDEKDRLEILEKFKIEKKKKEENRK